MHQYIFPVVFMKEEDETYSAFVPDLNLSINGDTIEKTFLLIQDYITVYCPYAQKIGEEDSLIPTKYEKIVETNKTRTVMLVDAYA